MSDIVQIKIGVDAKLIEWFRQTYGDASYSWLFNMLLENFKKVVTHSPNDYAALGAKELKRLIEENDGHTS